MNISFGGADPEQNPAFTMFPTKVGKYTYMNLNPTDEDKGKGYLAARYAVVGDVLTVWTLDPEKVKVAISHGSLRGNAGEGLGPSTVSDTPEHIAAFLKSSKSNELFEYFGSFEKVRGTQH